MRKCTAGSSKHWLTRSMAEGSLINVDDDESGSDFLHRRDDIRRGKAIREEPKVDEVMEAISSSSTEGDDRIDESDNDKEPWAVNYKDAMKIFRMTNVRGTRYPHRETMVKLGIAKDVDFMLKACGLTQFVSNARGTHKAETIQFLASVELRVYSASEARLKSRGGFGALTFEVNNEKYCLTANEFEELFELRPCNGLNVEFEREELAALWNMIADSSSYDPSKSKCSQIRNPGIRYFHKVIASTCFARHESGNVRRSELEMIDEGLKNALNHATDYGRVFEGNLNKNGFTRVLMKQLASYRQWASRLQTKGKTYICVGGTITRILEYCGVNFRSKPIPPEWLDLGYLRTHKFLEDGPRKGFWIYKFVLPPSAREAKILLPNVDLTAVGVAGNIAFLPLDEFLVGSRVQVHQPAQVSEQTEMDHEAPECFYFDDYADQKMPKAVKEAHKNLGLLKRWNKWQDKKIAALVTAFKEFKFGTSSHKERDSTPPDFRGPTPSPLTRSASTSREIRRRSTLEQPRRASSHVQRPMPSQQQPDTTPHYQNFDLNSMLQPEHTVDLGGEHYNYNAERTPELHIEPSSEPLPRRRSSSRSRRRRSTSATPQLEDTEVQTQMFTPQAMNFLDPLGSAPPYAYPPEQQQQPPYQDDMDMDPAGWSLFR